MQTDFLSLLPFLRALQPQTGAPQDDDDGDPQSGALVEPQVETQAPAGQTKGDALMRLLQSGLNSSAPAGDGTPSGDPNQTQTTLDGQSGGVGGQDTVAPGGSQVVTVPRGPSRIPKPGPDVKPDLNLKLTSPEQSWLTMTSLMQGIGRESPPAGMNPDGTADLTGSLMTPSRIHVPFGGLDINDIYQLAKTMVPGGAVPYKNVAPGAPANNIQRYLPGILTALQKKGLDDPEMLTYALATIAAESTNFTPATEGVKRSPGLSTNDGSNTTPGGTPYDKYANKNGNQGPVDAERYKGRGYVQLTGKGNYIDTGRAINRPDLVNNPDIATDPALAGPLLAQFLKTRESRIRTALQADDPEAARRVVNGGINGMRNFLPALQAGRRIVGLTPAPPPSLNIPGVAPQPLPNLSMPVTPPKLEGQ
jgi:peptidoglycan L-alanyl-D-glutamate endopeptidase CwlK